jgi:hypothetical protein
MYIKLTQIFVVSGNQCRHHRTFWFIYSNIIKNDGIFFRSTLLRMCGEDTLGHAASRNRLASQEPQIPLRNSWTGVRVWENGTHFDNLGKWWSVGRWGDSGSQSTGDICLVNNELAWHIPQVGAPVVAGESRHSKVSEVEGWWVGVRALPTYSRCAIGETTPGLTSLVQPLITCITLFLTLSLTLSFWVGCSGAALPMLLAEGGLVLVNVIFFTPDPHSWL